LCCVSVCWCCCLEDEHNETLDFFSDLGEKAIMKDILGKEREKELEATFTFSET
jgi:hypothetical protein